MIRVRLQKKNDAEFENIFCDTIDLTDKEGFFDAMEAENTVNLRRMKWLNVLPEDRHCERCYGKESGIKVFLACWHFFHHDCILEDLRLKPNCPICDHGVDFDLIEETISTRTKHTVKVIKPCVVVTVIALIATGVVFYFTYYKPKFE